MKKMKRVLGFVFAVVLMASCKKQTDEFTPYQNSDFNDINWSSKGMSDEKRDAMIKGFGNSLITANFDHLGTTQTTLSGTTKISLPANAYLVNGTNYTGQVIAQLSELKTKGDFIKQLMPSCNTNSIQEFRAAFNLNLKTSDNKTILFKNKESIDLYYIKNVPYTLSHKYFYGTGTGYNFLWNIENPNVGELRLSPIGSDQYFQVHTNAFGWMAINDDITNSFTNFTSSTVLTPTNFTNKNTLVFAVLKNYNTVLLLNADANSKTFSATNLPQDEPVTFVALSYLDGEYYLGFEQTIISKDIKVNIKTSLTPIKLTDLNTFLGLL